ncbi:MAG: hypothetical protein AAF682_27430 [Planctomycetota bacterium]
MIARKELSVPCYFDPTREAVIDPEHLVRVNYEIYLFSDLEKRERFLEDPAAWCGLVTDPVSMRRFQPRASSPAVEHDGVLWVFPTWSAERRFRADPEAYRLPRRRA